MSVRRRWLRARTTYGLILLLSLAAPVQAESEAPNDERLRLARELFDSAGGANSATEMMNAMLSSLQVAYQQLYRDLANQLDFESEAERTAFLQAYERQFQAFAETWQRMLNERVNLVQETIDTLVPIYAEMYTEDELKQLIDFNRSPLGRKVIEQQPKSMARGMQDLMKKIGPRLQDLANEAMAKERERLLLEARRGKGDSP
jgi:hypothetical protein